MNISPLSIITSLDSSTSDYSGLQRYPELAELIKKMNSLQIVVGWEDKWEFQTTTTIIWEPKPAIWESKHAPANLILQTIKFERGELIPLSGVPLPFFVV